MKVVHIDELADVCGYFATQTDANNGYGCNHPDQEEFKCCIKTTKVTRIERTKSQRLSKECVTLGLVHWRQSAIYKT